MPRSYFNHAQAQAAVNAIIAAGNGVCTQLVDRIGCSATSIVLPYQDGDVKGYVILREFVVRLDDATDMSEEQIAIETPITDGNDNRGGGK